MTVEIKTEELKTVLKKSIEEFYEKDYYLVENDLHEQAATACLKCHIERILNEIYGSNYYNIDNEYNRLLNNPKEIYTKCQSCKEKNCECKEATSQATCRPDIIVHFRGKTAAKDNALVIEVKKKDESDNDVKKLTYLTCNYSQYKYQLGAFIVINKNQIEITYFKNHIKKGTRIGIFDKKWGILWQEEK